MDTSGITIDNLLARHFISWAELKGIDVEQRLVFIRRDGTRLGSVMYGGSVIGQLSHYRLQRKTVARMRAVSEQFGGPATQPPPPSPASRLKIVFSPWPLLAFLALAEVLTAWPLVV